MQFDPNKKYDSEALPPTEVLCAMKSFERKTSKTSKAYLRARFIVIAGPLKGKSWFQMVSINHDSEGAMRFLSNLAKQCGCTKPFDTDSDSEIRAALVGRPFKCLLDRKTEGEYTNNSIARFIWGDKVTAGDRQAMDDFVAQQAEEGTYDGPGDEREDAPPIDDDSDLPF